MAAERTATHDAFEALTVPSAAARRRWRWLALVPVAVIPLVVPAGRIRLGERELNGLVGSYLYETVHHNTSNPVTNLRVSDIYQPTTMKVAWDGYSGEYSRVYDVARWQGGTQQEATTASVEHWDNSFSWTLGTQYIYAVRVNSWADGPYLGLPSPPPGASSGDIHHVEDGGASTWKYISATPLQVTVGDNQAADARYDLRYSTYTYLDHNFGTTMYRGGLFVGYASDNARVARSFLMFPVTAITTMGDACWAGRAYAYYVRSMASGSTTVGMQQVSNSWSQSALTWSTAPSLTPGSADQTVTVTHGTPGWYSFLMNEYITGSTLSSPFATGMASTSETSSKWAYFAKKEWDSAYAPYLLHAVGGPRTSP